MTQEKKAKRYDEAVKVAENIHRFSSDPVEIKRMEQIFPELKESKDEEIRKEIIEQINLLKSATLSDLKVNQFNSWIAWLEKQGENANFFNKIQIGDKVTRNRDGVLVNLSQLNRVAKPAERQGENSMGISEATKQKLKENLNKALEKQTPKFWNEFLDGGEQKPTNKVEPKFNIGDIVKHKDNPHLTYILKRFTDDGDYEFHAIGKDGNEGETCFAVVNYQDEWVLVKPRSSWSEQDESRLAHILHLLDVKDDKKYLLMFGLNSLQELEKDIAWLEFLKGRIQPQPKWSEEDENYYRICLDLCTGMTNGGVYAPYIKDEAINWLKSLRPQNRWKPSDEQINALDSTLQYSQVSHNSFEYLNSLFNDLKKLKGE